MGIIYNGSGRELYPVGNNVVSEGTLTSGTSTVSIAVNGLLPYNGNRGYVANDSISNGLSVQIAHSDTLLLSAFTLNGGEVFDLTGWDFSALKLTRGSGDAAYRR